jgi:iron complex outermembrane recepter protein
MKSNQQFVLLLLFWSLSTFSLAQTTITGTVTDEINKEPLPETTIAIKGTIAGALTDGNGKFSLKVANVPVTLKISCVGYQSIEIEVKDAGPHKISLKEGVTLMSEASVTGNRIEEKLIRTPVTIEKIFGKQLQQLGAFDTYTTLQGLKGVDLLSQSLTFKSVNLRGFGANNNNRFVQLTDGMDNRSPGLGFGFGSVAGVSDLDVDNIELLPGASSALYGPDALQGLMLTRTKSPFDYQGLSAQVKVGVNNVGKSDISAKPYTDVALRYAKTITEKLAFKVNLQAINGTDFIADNYDDRMTRARKNFFVTDPATSTVSLGYTPNHDKSTNFEYDGVNIYGDDVSNGGLFDYHIDSLKYNALRGKRVTRSGYKEFDLTGDKGKIFSYRANVALHYKINDHVEASIGWYFGNGNFIRTAPFREYYPNYLRNQFKVELRGDEFFVRAYQTTQNAEGFNMGGLARAMLDSTKTMANWATDFSNAYNLNPNITAARTAADNARLAPGSAGFNSLWTELTTTLNTDYVNTPAGKSARFKGVRVLDNSSMRHAEGMYNFKKFLPTALEVVTGASYRYYSMLTKGTIFPVTRTGNEFTIAEYGWYLQGTYLIKLSEDMYLKPTAAVRYDKNQYFKGGLTPRLSAVLTAGDHNVRASWQSAFRNPSPNQLLADGKIGEVGGAQSAVEAANLYNNPAYTEASVKLFAASATNDSSLLVKYAPAPDKFTTEKIQTWEIGYKGNIANHLYIDAFYYQSKYNDFIATQNYNQLKVAGSPLLGFKNGNNYTTYQVNFNNFNEIYVKGFGIGMEAVLGGGYSLSANYANQIGTITLKDAAGNILKDAFGKDIVERKMSNLEVSRVQRNFFISPENRYNIMLSNPKVTKLFGFSLAYRWTDKMWVEQGNTQGDVWLPAWNTVDAAFSYKIPAYRTIVKLGASNLLNKYYSQGYGLAQIGGVYYIALNFDEVLNK